jgi:pimeloyl-ACP methyl ester carboxylesterase
MAVARVNDREIYFEERGDGPPVLLVPGTGCPVDMWGELPAELSKDHRVIAYERRGFNRTGGSPAANQREHAGDAAGLLRALAAGPASVVGWSGGGLSALALAVEHPEMVDRLVLEEPSLHLLRHLSRSFLAAVLRASYLRLVRHDPAAAVEVTYRWVMSSTRGGSSWDRFPEAWRTEIRAHAKAIAAEGNQEAGRYPSRSQLASIPRPITCILGELSGYRAPSLELAKLCPSARLVDIEGAAHAVHFDRPSAFLDAVIEALDAA